ncbi:MAG: iron-containing alcohol dehydrogenase, partial [Bacteroidales bacterium]|nr:iron-containing alcohol dehydrogenase [Bacteroidales bacterium]
EAYFGEGDSPLSDSFAFSIIKEIIQIGDDLLENPEDYQLRARAMYAGTMALNGLLTQGKKGADWGVHAIGHTLSMLYDTPHGATLTIAYPAWMKFHAEKLEQRIEKLGKGIFGIDDTQTTIHLFEEFFTQIGCPINLEKIGLNKEHKSEIVELLNKNHASGVFHSLDENAREVTVNLMFLND